MKAKWSKNQETGDRKHTAKPQHFLLASRCQLRDLVEEKPELEASAHNKGSHI